MMTTGQKALQKAIEDAGFEMDRDLYINMNWAGLDLSEWTADMEFSLPEELQDWTQFKHDEATGELVYTGPAMGKPTDDEPDSDSTFDAVEVTPLHLEGD